ncbi:MAG: 4-(cytidine 5'-diphospho)-2-C-methyl-D-erythritol kinase [Lachnospiraceae bacterium]|nr:4-(cytidine 5'-diphospho)-2-C-methyl-D-erythritol kinase [Lachnospiraceae bacterium]
MEQCVVRKAYAKINLGLDVIGVLENGYHEVKMIMQNVGICDVLTLQKLPSGIVVTTDNGELPTDENNLIYKSARLMIENYQLQEGVQIHLEKHIPIAAGMAGGSTDAAATFLGMNELFGIGASEEELRQLGVKVGADVPYCIMGGTALAEGIGEKLTRMSSPPKAYLVIAKPDINVSTKYVYEHLDAEGVEKHPDIDGMITALEQGDLDGIINRLGNVLENVTVKKYPVIQEIKQCMLENGAAGSLMSGSGPTVFGIFKEKDTAEKALQVLQDRQLAKQLFVTGFCEGGTYAG